jgi:hypothetical protein
MARRDSTQASVQRCAAQNQGSTTPTCTLYIDRTVTRAARTAKGTGSVCIPAIYNHSRRPRHVTEHQHHATRRRYAVRAARPAALIRRGHEENGCERDHCGQRRQIFVVVVATKHESRYEKHGTPRTIDHSCGLYLTDGLDTSPRPLCEKGYRHQRSILRYLHERPANRR